MSVMRHVGRVGQLVTGSTCAALDAVAVLSAPALLLASLMLDLAQACLESLQLNFTWSHTIGMSLGLKGFQISHFRSGVVMEGFYIRRYVMREVPEGTQNVSEIGSSKVWLNV